MNVNSRNKKPSKAHLANKATEREYLDAMTDFNKRRGGRPWDEKLRDEYVDILTRFGVISPEWQEKLANRSPCLADVR